MVSLEAWLERRYPGASEILRLYSAAVARGDPAKGARARVEEIAKLVLVHVRGSGEPYRTALNWRRLAGRRPDLDDQDLMALQFEAELIALRAGDAVLSDTQHSGAASLASRTKTAMRRAIRRWVAETELFPPVARTPRGTGDQVTEDDVSGQDDDEGESFGVQKMLGHEGVGIVEGGHSLTVEPLVREAIEPWWRGTGDAENLCLQCGRPRLGDWFYWKRPGVKPQKNLTDFPFCSVACEEEFYGRNPGGATAPPSVELGFARILAVAAGEGFGTLGETLLGQARVAVAIGSEKNVLRLSRRGIKELRRHMGRARRATSASAATVESTLEPLDLEIWERRNDGRGSVARHRQELAQRGITMSPAAYRQRRSRVSERVEAAIARRVLGPGEGA